MIFIHIIWQIPPVLKSLTILAGSHYSDTKRHWHRCEPHHALDRRRLSWVLRLKTERLQETGEKEKELRTCQMLSGTRSLANGEGNEILVPLHSSMLPDESLWHELLSSAPFLTLLS